MENTYIKLGRGRERGRERERGRGITFYIHNVGYVTYYVSGFAMKYATLVSVCIILISVANS